MGGGGFPSQTLSSVQGKVNSDVCVVSAAVYLVVSDVLAAMIQCVSFTKQNQASNSQD